jgi:hypothetical protein
MFKAKCTPNLHRAYLGELWAIGFGKNAPSAKEYLPNGEIAPDLVTLLLLLLL